MLTGRSLTSELPLPGPSFRCLKAVSTWKEEVAVSPGRWVSLACMRLGPLVLGTYYLSSGGVLWNSSSGVSERLNRFSVIISITKPLIIESFPGLDAFPAGSHWFFWYFLSVFGGKNESSENVKQHRKDNTTRKWGPSDSQCWWALPEEGSEIVLMVGDREATVTAVRTALARCSLHSCWNGTFMFTKTH